MARHKALKRLGVYALVLSVIASGIAPVTKVYADNQKSEISTFAIKEVNTSTGVANFGRGNAKITINGNGAAQSLVGKKFNVYKLFDAVNSKNLESINYTLNPEYAQAIKNIVGVKLNK